MRNESGDTETTARLRSLEASVAQARRSVEAGRTPALDGLASRLAELLAAPDGLSAAERSIVWGLLDEANALAAALDSRKSELASDLRRFERNRRAAKAYGSKFNQGSRP